MTAHHNVSLPSEQEKKLKGLLIKHEALKLKPYLDSVGKLTIGVGRNLDDKGLSKQEALYLLQNDINESVLEANQYPWFSSLTPNRQNVIISMIFNLGLYGFSKFKKTIAYIEAKDYRMAAIEMLDSTWASQVGSRAIKLSKMMEEG